MIDLERLTLGALSQKAAAHFRNRLAFALYRDGHTFRRITYGEWGLRTRQFGGMLRTLGLKTGDRVLILAENCPEWPIVYFGAALGGFVSVPVLLAFSPEQIKTIGDHAGVAALCVTEKTCSKIAQAGIDPAIPRVYMDTLTEPDRVPGIRVSIQGREKRIPLGPGEGDWFPEIQEDDLASLWYTSGTTGASKGVMLSHRNLVFTAKASGSLMRIFPRDRLLSVLPLAHTYECTLGLVAALMSGASITYLDRPPAPAALLEAMQSLRPTAMVTVPIFIEKLYQSRIAPALKANPLYRFPLTRFLAIKIAGYKLMGAFGSSIRFFGIGGTALSPEVETFLRKAQFPYAPGYGLTETSPLVAGTAPYQFSAGSVGRLLTGVEVRISDAAGEDEGHPAGEIQVRGPNIMQGYYRDPVGTALAFTEDGWFKTGDVGYLDSKGQLFIRGRLKSLILGPSGENIYPEDIEGLLNASILVEEALVYPGERGELVALIVLSEKARTLWAALEEGLEELKGRVNTRLASFSRIHRIEVREEPFERTPTQKIKRFLYSKS